MHTRFEFRPGAGFVVATFLLSAIFHIGGHAQQEGKWIEVVDVQVIGA